MKSTTLIPAICLALSTACATTSAPTTQDIAFIGGCWIERTPEGGRHIRFLPDRDSPSTRTGYIPDFADYPATPETTVRLTFAANGASLTRTILNAEQSSIETATLQSAPPPPGAGPADHTAAWRFPGEQRWYIAQSTNDSTLRLFILDRSNQQPSQTEDFSGARDGCD